MKHIAMKYMETLVMIPDNTLSGNDTSHYQSMAKIYAINKLVKNVKNTQHCDEYLMYRLFLII